MAVHNLTNSFRLHLSSDTLDCYLTQADGETLVSLLRELKDERGYKVEASLCLGDLF